MRSFARSLPLGLVLLSQLLERRWSRTRPVAGPARVAKFVLASREGEAMGILACTALDRFRSASALVAPSPRGAAGRAPLTKQRAVCSF